MVAYLSLVKSVSNTVAITLALGLLLATGTLLAVGLPYLNKIQEERREAEFFERRELFFTNLQSQLIEAAKYPSSKEIPEELVRRLKGDFQLLRFQRLEPHDRERWERKIYFAVNR